MKGLHGGIPIAVLAAVARAQVDVIGGSDGFDSGNAGGVITDNDFGRATAEVNKDDHHVDINTKTKVDVDYDAYPDPYWHHWHPDGRPHWRKARGHGGDTVIGRPIGIDAEKDGGLPTKNEAVPSVKEGNIDDHSDHHKGKTDVDVDSHWNNHKGEPSGRNPPVTLIDGPGGIDTGNSASLPTTNKFASFYKEHNQDDHSVDIDQKFKYEYDVQGHPYPVPVPAPHWKREPGHSHHPPATLIDGPGGIDTGNSASLPTTNKFASFYKEHNQDDHSVDIDQKFKYEYDVHGHPYPVPVPAPHWKREPGHPHPPTTVIDGPGGIDTGNSASLPTTNQFASFYKEHNQDDHSVDVNTKFDYDQDTHFHPYAIPVPGHPHHWKARNLGDTVIDGPGGVNTGNSASIPTKNELGVGYSETNIDDHSVDIHQKTDIDVDTHWDYPVAVPVHPHWPHHGPHHLKGRNFGNTVIDGSGGVDRGNDASIPTKNALAFGYKETNIDDHSVDIDTKTNVDIDTDFHAVPYPVHYHPHPHHFHGRGLGDTVIDGPGGVDSGNGFSAPTDNEFASVYDEVNKDDHSFTGKASADWDIDNHYAVPYPYPVPGHPHHPVPGHPHHWKARSHPSVHPWKDVTLIDGPGGIDTGNDADLSTTNTFLSDYDEFNKDDHSYTSKAAADIDIDTHIPYSVPVPVPGHPHHWKARGHHEPPVTVIGGPHGIDTGNTADLSNVNIAISAYDEFNRDDHSFDSKAKADVDIDYRRSLHARFGNDLIDGPGGIDTGNSFSAPTNNNVVTGYSEYNKDDHSVDVDSKTDVDVDGHFQPVPIPHPVPAPHHPEHEDHHDHPEPEKHQDHPEHEKHQDHPQQEVHYDHPEPEKHQEHPEPEKHQEHPEPEKHQDHPEHEKHQDHPQQEVHYDHPEPEKHQDHPEPEKHQEHPEPEKHQDHPEHEKHQDHPQQEVHYDHPEPEKHQDHQDHPKPSVHQDHPEHEAHDDHPEQEKHQDHPQPEKQQDHPEHEKHQDHPEQEKHQDHPEHEKHQDHQDHPKPSVHQDLPEHEAHDDHPEQEKHQDHPEHEKQQDHQDQPKPSVHQDHPEQEKHHQPAPLAPNVPSGNTESDFSQPIVHSAPAAPAPSAPSFNEKIYQPAPPAAYNFPSQAGPATSVAHVALTSTVTVPQASSFSKIPVFVPQSSSAVSSAAHGPASSTVVVHPTGVAASTPSAASSSAAIASRANTVFTGGVAHLTPHAAVFSVVCGVVGLLAFVL